MRLATILSKFGLTDKESALYLAALELGSASVQKIAQKAGLVRSTAYEVLETLRTKGLLTTHLKKSVRYYSAEDPQNVVHFVEGHLQALKGALPELNALAGRSRKRPTMRFYEGKDGMGTILREILSEAGELLGYGSADDVFRELAAFGDFVAERVKKKIPVRVILRDSPKARERQRLGPKHLRQVKIIPAGRVFHGIKYIWKNKVSMFSFVDDYVAVVIESTALADMERALFENLWEQLKN